MECIEIARVKCVESIACFITLIDKPKSTFHRHYKLIEKTHNSHINQ